MKIPTIPTIQRDHIVVIALLTLALVAFPLLGSLLTDWTPRPPAAIAAVQTPTAPLVAPIAPTVTSTPLAPISAVMPTLAPTPADTSTPAPPTATPSPSLTPSPTVPPQTATPTPTLLPRVYVLPFRPVYLGSAPPAPDAPFLLYESGSDVFRTMEQQGTYVHLQALNGPTSFWTAQTNLSPSPPAAPSYDFTVRGRTVRLGGTGYACLHEANVVPPLAPCQPLANFSTATLNARITSGSVSLYLAEIGGRSYYLLTDNVL